MRGKIIVEKNYANGGWCTKFHGESGQLYYADLMPAHSLGSGLKPMVSECKILYCSTEGDDDSGIKWGTAPYQKQGISCTPETLRQCIEDFLGYPVDMELKE